MDRRRFLKTAASAACLSALPSPLRAETFRPVPGAWRTFEIQSRITLKNAAGAPAQAWIPVPTFSDPDWFMPVGNSWTSNAASAEIEHDAAHGTDMLHLQWAASDEAPWAIAISRASTRDRATDPAAPHSGQVLSSQERAHFTSPTALIPTDGIVKDTADRIVKGLDGDLVKARAIYEWVVENTFRNAKTRGCGIGDIAAMLESGNLGGKCADINALYVGLTRAAGLPVRDIYGLRVAPSRFGYRSLGANSAVVTTAQHCRAEVYIADLGWMPVDPADVRKVALEEPPGNIPVLDPKVTAARGTLFGAWEGNWLAYNTGQDITLPGSSGPAIDFLMYPQAEVASGRCDCLDAEAFAYDISAREIVG